MARKKGNDDWINAALGIGIGVLALYFIKKLAEQPTDEPTQKACQFCGYVTEKWARACPNCRNTFPI